MRRVLLALAALLMLTAVAAAPSDADRFSAADRQFLQAFSLAKLPPPPAAPSNAWADDAAAAALGRQLFFDTRLSAGGRFACASCHQPARHFSDGLPRALATGQTRRNTPSVLGAAHSLWLDWDGRTDSLWAQALGPIEDPNELALSRSEYVARLETLYPKAFNAVFGPQPGLPLVANMALPASPLGDESAQARWAALPPAVRDAIDRRFSQAGKALMAYQRRLSLPMARFDRFVEALARQDDAAAMSLMNANERAGLRLFMGAARCVGCHNGPLFTNQEFHSIGAPEADPSKVDLGRYAGLRALQANAFSCLTRWSDAAPEQCDEMRFLKTTGPELVGAFKTPSLRNVALTAPYMHAGQFETLEQVLEHYNAPKPPFFDPAQHPNRPHFDLLPLQLTPLQMQQIVAFLGTLSSPLPAQDAWWTPPRAP